MWGKLKKYGLLLMIFLLSVIALILSMPRQLVNSTRKVDKKAADKAFDDYEGVKQRHDREIEDSKQIDYPDRPDPFDDVGSAASFVNDLITRLRDRAGEL